MAFPVTNTTTTATPGNVATPPVQPAPFKYSDEAKFRQDFDNLHQTWWGNAFPLLDDNRRNREMLVDVDSMRAAGRLQPQQTFIAQRIIDINISREMPAIVAYLTQSRRLGLFQPVNNKLTVDTTELEMEFRRVLSYEGWTTDYQRWADGAKCVGYAFMSVGYDPELPGACRTEFVPSGMLAFDMRVKDIQMSPMIWRAYEITTVELEELALAYGFDPGVTAELNTRLLEIQQRTTAELGLQEATRIYNVFYKEKGKVLTAWYSKELIKFLKPFELFYNGVDIEQIVMPTGEGPDGMPSMDVTPQTQWVKAPETQYPFYTYLNRLTEREQIVKTMSRVDLDFYTQEAACSIWSATVNATTESSCTMWSPDNQNLEAGPSAPKQLTLQIKPGAIWNTPMRAFHSPPPDAMLPKVLEMLRAQNSEDNNNISFAVNNRRDTRKTATEIDAAQQQDTIMSSVQVTNWANALAPVLTAAWRIIQSQALQGKIVFCSTAPEEGAPNDVELIGIKYRIIPAGTVDYIERVERIASMQADLPIMMQTGAGQVFLEEYIRAKYPMLADKLIAALGQAAQQSQQVIQALVTMLQAAVTDENGNLEPEWQSHAQELAKLGVKAGQANQQNLQQGAAETAQQTPQLAE